MDAAKDATVAVVNIDYRELVALIGGIAITVALILKGDLETGKTIAVMLIGYGIGRAIPK